MMNNIDKINDLEVMQEENRKRILLHIGKLVYKRAPTTDEINKITLMLDIGKKLPDILRDIRNVNSPSEKYTSTIESKYSAYSANISDVESEYACSRTPLEKHFHEYVKP